LRDLSVRNGDGLRSEVVERTVRVQSGVEWKFPKADVSSLLSHRSLALDRPSSDVTSTSNKGAMVTSVNRPFVWVQLQYGLLTSIPKDLQSPIRKLSSLWSNLRLSSLQLY
jgi:hypothetical protein